MAGQGEIIGHYARSRTGHDVLTPLLGQSAPLFTSVVSDNANQLEAELERLPSVNELYLILLWDSSAASDAASESGQRDQAASSKVTCVARTLLMLAAYHGSLRCLALLLARGSDPSLQSPEGETAHQFALAGKSPHAATVRAMLDDAAGNFVLPRAAGGLDPVVAPPGAAVPQDAVLELALDVLAQQLPVCESPFREGNPYNTSELMRPEYSTDAFRMHCFKVVRCSKRYAHDWRSCPFAHPTENARRRDPREFTYCATACPDYKQGLCLRGDTCPYAHGVFECWLHPSRYKTQLCKDGSACTRPVCFFAHAIAELRSPSTPASGGDALARGDGGAGGAAAAAAAAAAAVASEALVPDDYDQDQDVRAAVQQQQAALAALAAMPRALVDGGAGNWGADVGSGGSGAGAAHHGSRSDQMQAAAADSGVDSAAKGLPAAASAGMGSRNASGSSLAARGSTPSPGPHQHTVPTAPVPRMSNAFARRHGLNPKDNPLRNLQILQQMVGGAPAEPSAQAWPPAGGRAGMAAQQQPQQQQRTRRRHSGPQQGRQQGRHPQQQHQQLLHPYGRMAQHMGDPHLHHHALLPLGGPAAPLLMGGAAGGMAGLPPGALHAAGGWPPVPPHQDAQSLALLFSSMGLGMPGMGPAHGMGHAPGGLALHGMPPGAHHLGGLGLDPNASFHHGDTGGFMGPPGPY